LTRTETQ